MKTSVKNLSETRVELTINVAKEELEAAKQVALKKLSNTVKVPGFRKGHVPIAMVAKHVDQQALAEQTLEDAISKAVAEAFTSSDTQALERPEVEIKKYVPGEMLEFTAEAEILPKITLGDYKKLKVTKEKVSVTAEDIDEVVDRIRTSLAEKKSVKRAAKDGDEAVIDFVGKKDGEAFEGGAGTDYPLVLGSNSFIPGFEAGLVGHKAGEEFDLDVKFPDDYHAENLKGQKVVFEVKIKNINEIVKPELDDKLAAKAGPFKSAEELTDDIKRELAAQKEREQDEKLKDDLVRQLVEKSEVPAPEVLVNDQAGSIEQDLTQNVMYSGMTLEQYIERKGFANYDEWREKEALPAAKARVQAGLVLSELSKELKVEATADELAQTIQTYRERYANNPEMTKRFDEPEVQRDIANRLLTEKTVEKLVEINTK